MQTETFCILIQDSRLDGDIEKEKDRTKYFLLELQG